MIPESRIREVMRERRCTWEEACSWLGKRGAEARARRRAAKYGRTTVGQFSAVVEPPLAGAWWMKDNF